MPARHHDIPNTPVQRPDSHDKNGPAVSSHLETAANITDPATPAIPAAMILTEPAYRRTTVMSHPKQKPLCQSGNRIPPDKKEMTGRFRKTFSNGNLNTSTGPGHPPYRRKSGKSPSKVLQYTFPTIKKMPPSSLTDLLYRQNAARFCGHPRHRPCTAQTSFRHDRAKHFLTLHQFCKILSQFTTVFRPGILMNLFRISPSPYMARKSGAKSDWPPVPWPDDPAAGMPRRSVISGAAATEPPTRAGIVPTGFPAAWSYREIPFTRKRTSGRSAFSGGSRPEIPKPAKPEKDGTARNRFHRHPDGGTRGKPSPACRFLPHPVTGRTAASGDMREKDMKAAGRNLPNREYTVAGQWTRAEPASPSLPDRTAPDNPAPGQTVFFQQTGKIVSRFDNSRSGPAPDGIPGNRFGLSVDINIGTVSKVGNTDIVIHHNLIPVTTLRGSGKRVLNTASTALPAYSLLHEGFLFTDTRPSRLIEDRNRHLQPTRKCLSAKGMFSTAYELLRANQQSIMFC